MTNMPTTDDDVILIVLRQGITRLLIRFSFTFVLYPGTAYSSAFFVDSMIC